jgi:hypothetical protein
VVILEYRAGACHDVRGDAQFLRLLHASAQVEFERPAELGPLTRLPCRSASDPAAPGLTPEG